LDEVLLRTSKGFWFYVEKTETCWLWKGAIAKNGYGTFHVPGSGMNGSTVYAHRYAFEELVNKIPYKMDLDHKCRIRRCVNPNHLEVVSRSENLKRGRALETASTRRMRAARKRIFPGDWSP